MHMRKGISETNEIDKYTIKRPTTTKKQHKKLCWKDQPNQLTIDKADKFIKSWKTWYNN